MIEILNAHEDEVTEVTKPITGVGSLALVAKKEIMKLKKSNEKVIVAHYSSNAINDECISDEKALIVSNPKKFFKILFFKVQKWWKFNVQKWRFRLQRW